jgi:hypothetical protein
MENTTDTTENEDNIIELPNNVYYFTYIVMFITGTMLWLTNIRDAFSVWPFFVSTVIFSFLLGWDIYNKYNLYNSTYFMIFIILFIIAGSIMNLISGAYFGFTLEKLRSAFAKRQIKVDFDKKHSDILVWFQSFWVISTILILIASKYLYFSQSKIASFVVKTLSIFPMLNMNIHVVISIVLFILIFSLGITIYDIIYTKYGDASDLNEFRLYFNSLVGVLSALFLSITGIEIFKYIKPTYLLLFVFFTCITSIVLIIVSSLNEKFRFLDIFSYVLLVFSVLFGIMAYVLRKNTKFNMTWFSFFKVDYLSKMIRVMSIVISFILSGILFEKFISIPDVKITYANHHFYEIFTSFIIFVFVFLLISSLYYIFETTTINIIRFLHWGVPMLIVAFSGYQIHLVRLFSHLMDASMSE